MTMIGAIRKNKTELTKKMLNKKVHSSSFFTEDSTVVYYAPKKTKILFSWALFNMTMTLATQLAENSKDIKI